MNLQNGSVIKNFEILKLIGKGSFASVYKVRRIKDNSIYAMKVMNGYSLKREDKLGLINEINILSKNSCPHLIKFYEVFIDKNIFYIIMEYARNKDLREFLKYRKLKNRPLSLETIYKFFYQICKGVKYLHDHNVIHRDLKPANIMIDNDYNIKIGDFGISKIFTEQNKFARTQIGSPIYMSPEAISHCRYDTKTDIWALGCILYELDTLDHAFNANNMPALCRIIKIGNINKHRIKNKNLINLISNMLCKDQYSRPDITNILNQIPYKPEESTLTKTNNKLLPALCVPSNLNQWDKILPKPTYNTSLLPSISTPEIKNNISNDNIKRSKSELGNNKNIPNNKQKNNFLPKIVVHKHNDIKSINYFDNKRPKFNEKKENNKVEPINKLEPINVNRNYNRYKPQINNYEKKKSNINNIRRGKKEYGKNYISPYNQFVLRNNVNLLYDMNKCNKNNYISEYKAQYNNKNILPKINNNYIKKII